MFYACRLASRLAKGMEPQPNCTGEEMALHKIIEMARYDDFEAFDDELEALPSHPKDDDFDMVSLSRQKLQHCLEAASGRLQCGGACPCMYT
jgi:hypothetical protein